ncbi:MAG: GH3 auxin-responsive promoter family protein, partial [Bacteroidota bacterium]|nr:GH3 auxin-responsive promoter family protein [Bacteroidota bacterium]
MGIKSALSGPLARYIARRHQRWQHRPETTQRELLAKLTATAAGTAFGRAHDLGGIRTPADLARQVPVRDYEAL